MKLSVLQENISKAVSAVSRIVPAHPQLPVLSNMLLKAQNGKLLVIGTDLSLSIGISIGGKIEEDGSATVPAKDFSALVSRLSAERVEIVETKGELSLKAGVTRAKLPTIAAGEFPDIETPESKGVIIPLSAFTSAMKRVLFAVSQDDSRPILTGVKFETEAKGALQLISTDGYRLSRVALSHVKGNLDRSVIIPARVLSEVVRVMVGDRIELQLSDSGGVKFLCDGAWVSGRLLAGEFPPAERIIPEKVETEITFGKSEFEQAVRIAAIFARESANIVKLHIEKGNMTVSANSPQIGQNETEIEVEGGGGASHGEDIAFNSTYLQDWVSSIESDRVTIGMVNALKPGVFRSASAAGEEQRDKDYTHVIMPVRTQKEPSG